MPTQASIWLTTPPSPCSRNFQTIAQAIAEVTTGAKKTVRKNTTPKNGRDSASASVSASAMLSGTSPSAKITELRTTCQKSGLREQRVVKIVEPDEGRLLGQQVPFGHRIVDDGDQRPEEEDQEADQRRADEQPGFQHLPVSSR